MHSIFLRIFLLFLLAMTLIVGSSIATTFTIASRVNEPLDSQRRPSAAMQAAEVLARGGLAELRTWLQGTSKSPGDRELFVVGPDGQDILGRRLPERDRKRLDSFRDPVPENFRAPRPAPQIIAPDGSVYTLLQAARQRRIFGALGLPAISLTILGIALVVSALTSWWLADHLTSPIRRIQAGARALATENLDVRVSAGLEYRKDELAVLARDFDAMADQLRANRTATTQLLRDVSHELRSPLARMRVALGLARQLPADCSRQLDRLERELERLDAMISQVLKLARLQGADAMLTREPFELDEVIAEVVRDANFEAAVKNCRVNLQGASHEAVLGDRELLRSAVENVLRNAVRYSPDDAAVDVMVARAASGLEIRIRDRGPGVPSSELERIFEPFYRVAESRDRDSGGEGIGLAITAQVMKAHGGVGSAANAQGGGLEVLLSLPESAIAV